MELGKLIFMKIEKKCFSMITNIKTTIPETNIPLDPNFEEKYR